MGSVCTKSDTKKKKKVAAGRSEGDKAQATEQQQQQQKPAAPTPGNNSDPRYSVHESDAARDERSDAAAASGAQPKDTVSSFTLSTAQNESKKETIDLRGPSTGNANRFNETQPMHTETDAAANAACPEPSQTGDNFDKWFPPEHDAGMKLGDGKYKGVGVQTPSSKAASVELHSFASASSDHASSPVKSTASAALAPPPSSSPSAQLGTRKYNPLLFVDEDSAAPETASSAFLTPRELREDSSMASMADNASLVSHGSMASQHAHGYRYYNSSNAGLDAYPTPMSSQRRSGAPASVTASAAATPPQTQRSAKTAMTVTNVRTNRQVPMSSPLSRQTSRAESDRFQSCRSLGDASASAASYLPPGTPAGTAVTEADVRLLSAQPGSNYNARRRGSLSSQLCGYPPLGTPGSMSAGAGSNPVFYSCRSLATASEQSAVSPMTGTLGSTRIASPISIQRPPSSASLYALNNQNSNNSSNLRGVAASLPPRSARGSPMAYYGNTPNAQQELLHRQASRQSAFGGTPASEFFFSVNDGSPSDVFLDLPSAADTSTVYTLDDDRDLEPTSGARATARSEKALSVRSRTTDSHQLVSPVSFYSAVDAVTTPAPAGGAAGARAVSSSSPQDTQKTGTEVAVSVDSPYSSSASSTWLSAPVLTKTKIPADRQRRSTVPHIERAEANTDRKSNAAAATATAPLLSKSSESSTRDYDADLSSVATSKKMESTTKKNSGKKKTVPAKQYYTRADFPPNPHTPPQAKALTAPAAAVADAKAASPPSLPKGASAAASGAEVGVMDATFITLSTPSETSTRKSGANRPTVIYPRSEDREVGSDEQGDAARPQARKDIAEVPSAPTPLAKKDLEVQPPPQEPQEPQPLYTMPTASSTHSFSTVASSYRREQQHGSGAPSPVSSQVEAQGLRGIGGPAAQARNRRRRMSQNRLPRRGAKTRSSVQYDKVTADTTAMAAASAAAAPPAPLMTNPNPWVPGAPPEDATSTHVDPYVVDRNGQPHPRRRSSAATPASVVAAPRTPGGGAAATAMTADRGRLVRRISTPAAAGAGRGSIPPGRRTSHATPPPAAAVPRAITAASPGQHVYRLRPPHEESPSSSSLTPTHATGAAKTRQSTKKTVAAEALASPPLQSLTELSELRPVTRMTDGGDSIVEYELFTGELADAEVDSTVDEDEEEEMHTSGSRAAPKTSAQALPQQSQQQQRESSSNNRLPASRTSPKPRSAEPSRHTGGFHASPDISRAALTSAETSEFMQPYSDAVLAAELNSGDAELPEGTWLGTATTTATAVVVQDGNVVMRVEMAEARPPPEEETDEGYDADSGMEPNTDDAAVPPSSSSPLPPPPRSVSATSNEEVAVSPTVTKVAVEPTLDGAAPLTNSSNSAASPTADGVGGKEGESSHGNVVDLSSNSLESESEISSTSPAVVG